MVLYDWLTLLASGAPTPGGGGAAAMTGAMSAGLCAMSAALTANKKKYECYKADLERLYAESRAKTDTLYELIAKDANAFFPLSKAYGIPKDQPGRDEKLEKALRGAASAPMEILETLSALPPMLAELVEKGSKLMSSDVACGASLCASAAECALLNVLVNTNLMKDRAYADDLNERAKALEASIRSACDAVTKGVMERL